MSKRTKAILACVLWAAGISAITYDAGLLTAAGVFVSFWANNLEQKS